MKKIILKSVLTLALVTLFGLKSNAQMVPCSAPSSTPPCIICAPACQQYTFINHTQCEVAFSYWYQGCNLLQGAHSPSPFVGTATGPTILGGNPSCAKCPSGDLTQCICECAAQVNINFTNGTALTYGPTGFGGGYPVSFIDPNNGGAPNQIGGSVAPTEPYAETDLQTSCGCPIGQTLFIQAWEDPAQTQAIISVICK